MMTSHFLQFIAQTHLPTHNGTLVVRAYRNTETLQEPLAIVGQITDNPTPVRIHDACFTSETLGSLKCDCKEQLDFAIQYIQEHGGVVIYLQQEGRGIGLANKIAAYALQEDGLDTVEANRALHLPDDNRIYDDAAAILEELKIDTIALMTNNPRKMEALQQLGIRVHSRIPIQVASSSNSHHYLATKATKMGHLLDLKKGS